MAGSSLASQLLWCASLAMCATAAAAGAVCDPAAPAAPDAVGEWWVDLSLAPSARVPAAGRAAHLQRIRQQQAQMAAGLGELGLTVSAAVVHVRNAVVVQMTAAQASSVRRTQGVLAVRPALDCHRVGQTHADHPAANAARAAGPADVFFQAASWRSAGSGKAR